MEKIDVAVNIFAKPFRTSLSLLSLLRQSGAHIGTLWLQFEPMGITGDIISPYAIYEYLVEKNLVSCKVSQPAIWLARNAVTEKDFSDPARRMAIRYQYAFENSQAPLLFIMHNDVFIQKDILGAMRERIGDAFAIGQLGQCWNCPASNGQLMLEIFNKPACTPATYQEWQPGHKELCHLYAAAQERGIFVRPYDVEHGEFAARPWPLPECRVNEWACLINLQKTRSFCAPYGDDYPPGAYRSCGEHNLDIGVPWFRDMHKHGFTARDFDISSYMRHWVGTGNNTPMRYAKAEDKALRILRRHFGDYIAWLEQKTGDALPV